jgi:hypothetical protein
MSLLSGLHLYSFQLCHQEQTTREACWKPLSFRKGEYTDRPNLRSAHVPLLYWKLMSFRKEHTGHPNSRASHVTPTYRISVSSQHNLLTSHSRLSADSLPRAGLVLHYTSYQRDVPPILPTPQVSLICQTPRHKRERRSEAQIFCAVELWPRRCTSTGAIPYEILNAGTKKDEFCLEVENKHNYDIGNRLNYLLLKRRFSYSASHVGFVEHKVTLSLFFMMVIIPPLIPSHLSPLLR